MAKPDTKHILDKLRSSPPKSAQPGSQDPQSKADTPFRGQVDYALESCEACLHDKEKAKAWLKKHMAKIPDDLKNRAEAACEDA